MDLKISAHDLQLTDEGFLSDSQAWNESVASQLAALNNINITQQHWEIIYFIREYYQRFQHLPNSRVFTKAIRGKLGEEKGNSHYLHGLFPEGPLKFACKLAGLPKPPTCL